MIDFDGLVIGPCISIFGELVVFTPPDALPVTVTGIYTDNFVESKFLAGDEIVDTKSMLACQASQFPGNTPCQNDQFVIRGRFWRVIEVIEDGHGHIRMHIGLANDQQAAIPELPAPIS